MIENFVVAFSNLPCIYPIIKSIINRDYITAAAITFVSIASFVSHLVENHKHGMPGIGFSKKTSYILNRFDVLGCVLVIFRFDYLFYQRNMFSYEFFLKHKIFFICACIPPILLIISEYDKYNPKLKYRYIITHSIWHASIFVLMGKFLSI
ncbi:MAG: hypothetical protein Satyrvirus2_13 [Satyrvirus sp.]|uniref:Uncharacterized protein n=1 Tax=Satyrvirus sp. TaxID=2487771 RepID=A0A3G5ACW6_9VIRU|nr:MAG: hypothetical protein Satyrvirus2_13 [Satyrvirus sp.]